MYRFGRFRYDAAQRVLYAGDELVPAPPKALDVLQALLERRDRIVDKAELMKLVWPDTVVEEIGLARNVSILRKALGEPEAGTFIETVPKRGYRFVAEVTVDEDATHIPSRERGGAVRKSRIAVAVGAALLMLLIYWQFYVPSRYLPGGNRAPSVAVIPFQALSGELDSQRIPEALNELLVTELAKHPGMRVLSPSTVRRYQALHISTSLMARLIGIQAVLEGTVSKGSDGGLVITARLGDVHTGKLIWAETYQTASAGQETARLIAAGAGANLK